MENRNTATAEELSRALHVTSANIRYHLNRMVSEGVIAIVGERKIKGRGRPKQLYSLATFADQHSLDSLASALLDEIREDALQENGNQAGQNQRLKKVAQRLSQKDPSSQPPASTTQRLFGAVRRLNELHYQARWEAHSDAPRVILEHCPYQAILAAHPELCQIDAYLLEMMLSLKAEQSDKLVRNPQGVPQCIFRMTR